MELMKIKVAEVIDETDDVKTFRFIPNRKLDFQPGQFVLVHADPGSGRIKRAYSIASSPLEDHMDLTIKLTPDGKLTPYMFNGVKQGDIFTCSPPMGKFTYEGEQKIVLIAGGAGIAPLMSIIRYCRDMDNKADITLLYSSKTPDDIIYRKELDALKEVKVVHTMTQHTEWPGHKGRIDKDLIEQYAELDATFFLCGSREFALNIANALKLLRVPRQRIKRDVWG